LFNVLLRVEFAQEVEIFWVLHRTFDLSPGIVDWSGSGKNHKTGDDHQQLHISSQKFKQTLKESTEFLCFIKEVYQKLISVITSIDDGLENQWLKIISNGKE
jgi:hypothetical protein